MGALYEDANNSNKSGYHICEEFYINIVEEEIDFEDIIANDSNHKSKLIQYYQHNFQMTPTFKILRKESDGDGDEDDEFTITMSVLDNKGNVLVTADGETEKQAEQNVSRVALEKLKAFTINN